MTPAAHDRRWAAILAAHRQAVDEFVEYAAGLTDRRWRRAPRPGAWTPAAVTVHLCQSYEVGLAAVRDGLAMRLRVPSPVAWVLGRFYLPVILARGRFPAGAVAPVEVRPDPAAVANLSISAGTHRLRAVAEETAAALLAAPSSLRVRHAYFGSLGPATALRLLSAHTAHHTRLLRESPMAPAG